MGKRTPLTFHCDGNLFAAIRYITKTEVTDWKFDNDDDMLECIDMTIDKAYDPANQVPNKKNKKKRAVKSETKSESKPETVRETLHNMEKKYEEKYNELEKEVKTNEAKQIAANERLSGRLSTLERKLGIGYQIPEDLHEAAYGAPAFTSSSNSDSESKEQKEQTKKVQKTLIPSPKNKRKRTGSESKGVHGQSPSKKQHKDPLQ